MSGGESLSALPPGWEIMPPPKQLPSVSWLAIGPVGASGYAPNVTAMHREVHRAGLDSWAEEEISGAKEMLPSLFVIDSAYLMLGGVETRMDLIIVTMEGRHLTQTQYCIPPNPGKNTEATGTVITSSCATVDFPQMADALRDVVDLFIGGEG